MILLSVELKEFPDMGILAEESSDDLSRLEKRYCFLVDPLDGTKEFIRGNDEFTVNIALTEWGKPIGGVIYVPVYKELYYGWAGEGAFSLINGEEKRLHVSKRIGNIRLAKSRTHHSHMLDKLISINNINHVIVAGSAYKGCLLARGDVEAYYRFGRTMEWDTAAMEIIATEAGGIFSGMDGNQFKYNKRILKILKDFIYLTTKPINCQSLWNKHFNMFREQFYRYMCFKTYLPIYIDWERSCTFHCCPCSS